MAATDAMVAQVREAYRRHQEEGAELVNPHPDGSYDAAEWDRLMAALMVNCIAAPRVAVPEAACAS